MDKYCTKCGAVLKENAVFCGKCGTKQVAANDNDCLSVSSEATIADQTDCKERKKIGLFVIVGMIAVCAIVLLCVSLGSNRHNAEDNILETPKTQVTIDADKTPDGEEGEAHTYNSGVVTKEPTTSSTGIMTYTCTKCGSIKTETIPKIEQPSQIGYEAPYCPGDFSKIGQTFSSFHVAGTGLQYSPASLAILLKQEYPFNCPGKGMYYEGWEAYTDYNGYGSRVGVYNDRIVFNIQDIADGTKVSESLPGDMLAIEPLIIYGYDDYGVVREQMLIWRGDNGYSIGFAEARGYPNGSYLDENIKFYISTVDLMHIYGIPQEVIDANPAF